MSTNESELFHRLFTKATEGEPGETTGARALVIKERDASATLSAVALSALDDLLRKAHPSASEPAWVARGRFTASDGGAYTCVVVSYPDLVRDAKGRSGFLGHATRAHS